MPSVLTGLLESTNAIHLDRLKRMCAPNPGEDQYSKVDLQESGVHVAFAEQQRFNGYACAQTVDYGHRRTVALDKRVKAYHYSTHN